MMSASVKREYDRHVEALGAEFLLTKEGFAIIRGADMGPAHRQREPYV